MAAFQALFPNIFSLKVSVVDFHLGHTSNEKERALKRVTFSVQYLNLSLKIQGSQ